MVETGYLKRVKMVMEEQASYNLPQIKVSISSDMFGTFKELIGDSIDVHESFVALFFNQKMESIGWFKVSSGGINMAVVDIRILMSSALNSLATGIAICHNHPSGSLDPSKEDKNITNDIVDACKILNIRMVDHLIVSQKGYMSFMDEGLIE